MLGPVSWWEGAAQTAEWESFCFIFFAFTFLLGLLCIFSFEFSLSKVYLISKVTVVILDLATFFIYFNLLLLVILMNGSNMTLTVIISRRRTVFPKRSRRWSREWIKCRLNGECISFINFFSHSSDRLWVQFPLSVCWLWQLFIQWRRAKWFEDRDSRTSQPLRSALAFAAPMGTRFI